MAANDKTWISGSATQAQVDTITPAGTTDGDSWAFTLTDEKGQGHTITVASTATATVKEVCDLMTVAAAASFDQEWAKITVADDDTALTFTADTAGVPFYLVLVVTGTGTFTNVHTTVNKGPNDYNCINNWLEGAVPLADSTIYIAGSADDILYGLHVASVSAVAAAQTNALTLQETINISALYIMPGCSTNIGSNQAYLHLAVDGTGTNMIRLEGSGIVWLNVDNYDAIMTVKQSSSGASDGTYGTNLLFDEDDDAGGGSTQLVLDLPSSSATVGIGAQAGETAAEADFVSLKVSNGEVFLGAHACPVITTDRSAKVHNKTNFTTLTQHSGTFYNEGTASVTTANILGGIFVANSSGTITTLNISNSAVADFSQDLQSKTVTNANAYGQSTIKDPSGTVTFTNGIDLHNANLDTITLNLAPNKTWTQSAI